MIEAKVLNLVINGIPSILSDVANNGTGAVEYKF